MSAFTHRAGVPFELWQAAIEGRFTLLLSPALVSEAARILRVKFVWSEQRIVRGAKALVRAAEVVRPEIALIVVKDDPDDDRVLGCAVSGKADLTVSGDRHLRDLGSYDGIGIVRPVDFHRILGRERGTRASIGLH